jgi:AbrB family looped-hinge helix DNA binding protein
MIVGKLGKKGQIVIPKEIREKLHLAPNDAFSFHVHDETILLKKIGEDIGESIVDLLERCKPFPPNFLGTLRDEWS